MTIESEANLNSAVPATMTEPVKPAPSTSEGLPPAMVTRPDFIFFTDFDGTITKTDSNDHLTDTYGFGRARRREMNLAVLDGKMRFCDNFHAMIASVSEAMGFWEAVEALKQTIELDEGFKDFMRWCQGQQHQSNERKKIPVVVLSGGMRPIIEALFHKLLEDEALEKELSIVSNDVGLCPGQENGDIKDKGTWEIKFHDTSEHGHDKSLELRRYSSLPRGTRPIMFYAGDGVSDLSAARETDLLFAKEGCGKLIYTFSFHSSLLFLPLVLWLSK